MTQDQANQAVAGIKSRTNEIVNHLKETINGIRADETTMIEEIRSKETDLITKVNQNSERWHSKELKIKVKSPHLCEFFTVLQKFDGPFSSVNKWETVGQIRKIYPNCKFSFEIKIDHYEATSIWKILQIFNWFLLSLQRQPDGQSYIIKWKQLACFEFDEAINTDNPVVINWRQYYKGQINRNKTCSITNYIVG